MKRLALAAALLATPAAAQEIRDPLLFRSTPVRAYERGLPGPVPTGAVVRSFRSVDTNRSGIWDPQEIVAAFGSSARDVVLTLDADGDGDVTLLELRALDDGGTGGPDGILWEEPRG